MCGFNFAMFLVLLRLFGQAASLLNVAGVDCGRIRIREGRIKGGQDAVEGEYPWLVSLRVAGARSAHYCGGFLIHQKFVMTAAHCVAGRTTKYLAVIAGEHDMRVRGIAHRQTFKVKQMITHPNFTDRYINDIALLELATNAVWGQYVQPLCLPDYNNDQLTDDANVTVAGWGRTDESSKSGKKAQVLQKVTVKVINKGSCQSWINQFADTKNIDHPQLYDSHICAGFENGQKDSCDGDSGGALMKKNGGGISVGVGIVSAGIGCGRPRLPGLYTRVASFIPWITQHIKTTRLS